MATFFVLLHDLDRDQFRGAVVIDMDESKRKKSNLQIARHVPRLTGVDLLGMACIVFKANDDDPPQIKPEHKNRLITDEALLMQLGYVGLVPDVLN